MYHFHSEAFHHQDTKAQRILGVLVVDSKTQIFILNRYKYLDGWLPVRETPGIGSLKGLWDCGIFRADATVELRSTRSWQKHRFAGADMGVTMFFLIGGVQPKTVTLDDTPRLCPSCGLAQGRLRRVDHYLSLFFLPLFPVKRGEPVVICNRCGTVSSPDQGFRPMPSAVDRTKCTRCGYPLEATFQYCPNCGSRVEYK
jgi:hypothetical protein